MSASEAVYMMFASQPWNSQHSRTRALSIELANQGHHTIYVNLPGSVAGIAREFLASFVYPLRRENVHFLHNAETLEVWSPPTLPTFYRGSLTPGFDRWLFKGWFEKRLRTIKKPIIAIIVMPYWWDGYLNDYVQSFSATVYDHKDPIGTYARSAGIHQRMSEVFTELVSQVTGIITHTEANYRSFLVHRKPSEICLVRNAGYGISASRSHNSDPRRETVCPVIGTVGRISKNIDVALLLELADRFPGSSIVNIGTVLKDTRALRAKKNIVLMPPMLRDEFHSHISRFDVGILPYHSNIEGSPLRVYDLLSELLQVVSTKFPDSEYFKDVVHIAGDHDDFIAKVSDLLSGKKNWIPEEAIERFVSANTWKMRVEKLTQFCERLLDCQ
jgi:glycosyltransferase involved in cell wall biosynthesis